MRLDRRASARAATVLGAALAVAALAGLAASACAASEETTRLGYVIAPSVPADGDPPPGSPFDVSPADAGHGTTLAITRPLPPEPAPTRTQAGCPRSVTCREEEDDAPAVAFPAPFERCPETHGKGTLPAHFSARETRTARQSDPAACCYVEFPPCRGPQRPVPGPVPAPGPSP